MPAPQKVLDLIDLYQRNADEYTAATFKEATARIQFINPMFKALGWDMANEEGHAEAYKDVIHEASLKIGGSTEAPDYCFRVGGTAKFYLEAKKPAVNVKEDSVSAYQLRRYAWSAKLPLSILTDFEEFAIYDGRVRPYHTDKASTARILYLRYSDYADNWDLIAGVFGRDAVLGGSFDKYAEANKAKRGTDPVDAVFLEEIQGWRRELAKNLADRNKSLSARELNYAVQLTIDRIIFLRNCEDRGAETYGQLKELLDEPEIYANLVTIFRKADDRYNSGLFHFNPEKDRPEAHDALTPGLSVDDKVLKRIIKAIYYPISPYEFSVMSPEILGQVYEQFLGKVIRLTTGHQAKVEDKPEVKKAGGVYYTPTYIVDYIVQQTINKFLEGKTPKEVSKLTIVDPACGSGSFLLGAYQHLLTWHLTQYEADGPEKRKREVFRDSHGAWRLTTAEKKRILLNNIYGVDIDLQAVEVTKLSLLLKVLEGETQETINQQRVLFHERVLPDLASNIKCGNSLVGLDFYANQSASLFDEEANLRLNAFDWWVTFPKIKKAGGFDAVIGNPPYLDSELMTQFLPETRAYCTQHYAAGSGNWDIYCVFIDKAAQLAKPLGLVGMIVPNKLAAAEYAGPTRRIAALDNRLVDIRDYSHVKVFRVSVYPIVVVLQKGKPKGMPNLTVSFERMATGEDGKIECQESERLEYVRHFGDPDRPWQIFGSLLKENPADKMRQSCPALEAMATVVGAATVAEAYEFRDLISEGTGRFDPATELRLVNSGTIDRYAVLWGRKRCRYLGTSYQHPVVSGKAITQLPGTRRQQARSPKIIIAGMTLRLECILDSGITLAGKSTTVVMSRYDLRYLLGILNSRAMAFYYNSEFGGQKLQGGYLRIGPPQIRKMPIPAVNPKDDTGRHDRLVQMVDRMAELQEKLAQATVPHSRTVLERQIAGLDQQIDLLVYDLYNLTEEEVEIVEAET